MPTNSTKTPHYRKANLDNPESNTNRYKHQELMNVAIFIVKHYFPHSLDALLHSFQQFELTDPSNLEQHEYIRRVYCQIFNQPYDDTVLANNIMSARNRFGIIDTSFPDPFNKPIPVTLPKDTMKKNHSDRFNESKALIVGLAYDWIHTIHDHVDTHGLRVTWDKMKQCHLQDTVQDTVHDTVHDTEFQSYDTEYVRGAKRRRIN